ncbi:MAG: serine/threonine-protein kinase [Candidatus Margulisiibacteriota bacterium]
MITSKLSEQGGMSTAYRAIDLKKLQMLGLEQLRSLGIAKLKKINLAKLDAIDADLFDLCRLTITRSGLKALESMKELASTKVIIKCAENRMARALISEAAALEKITTSNPVENNVSLGIPEHVESGPLPNSRPDSSGNTPYYLAMRDLDGPSLNYYLESNSLTVNQTVEIAIQMLGALKSINSNGLIHRDLKPGNILITNEINIGLKAFLIDLGLAIEIGKEDKDIKQGVVKGTLNYMPPEAFGHLYSSEMISSFGPAYDIYSLGIILYGLLAWSTNPMRGGSFLAVANNQINEPFPNLPKAAITERFEGRNAIWLSPVLNGLHSRLDNIIQSMTDKDPAKRPSELNELIASLRQAQRLAKSIEEYEVYQMLPASEVAEVTGVSEEQPYPF